MATNKKPGKWRARTMAVRGGQTRSDFQETSEALFLTSGYAYESPTQAEGRFTGEDDGFQYTRFSNPTIQMFEDRMAALEGAPVARATASGMAAVSAALLSGLSAGDHIVSAKAMFGSCRTVIIDILPRFGVTHTLVDGSDLDQWRTAMRPNTKMLFLETPANPTLDIVDIAAVAKIADAGGARLVVDNAFASPVLQQPMALGAHIVVHSTTKWVDGQGRCLGGMILCREDFLKDHLQLYLRNTGPVMSPFNAWVHLKSLETLDLRMRAHCENAMMVANFLGGQKKVTRVLYPFHPDHPQHNLARAQMSGGGGVVTFEIAGGKNGAFRFAEALKLIDISNNLGDAKSLITHPETTTHQRLSPEGRAELGITSGQMRLSVGLEDADDIREDLEQALEAA
ncbi:MAG TPA: O-succinylhomoserine sulfhydrylase [Rhizomicrobium sp.]|jgi:O-succinylhomoserine sulfhydrylase|nr:O-succinylhomoserine sulfhydrylase [Rhizomicrobium sp.]